MVNESREMSPLVTVNILSFNRKDELRHTLTKVFEQDYKNIEVIVVDNASSDGTCNMVRSEFQKVELIDLNNNIGIAAWNKGFEIAKGEFVLALDDDSYPDKYCIRNALNKIEENENNVLVACRVFNGARNKFETDSFTKPYHQFVGCGTLINKCKFFKVGGFNHNIFLYVHEEDFAIRAMNLNYTIDYAPNATIFHRVLNYKKTSPINNPLYFKYSTLNNYRLNFKYLPLKIMIYANIKYFINRLLVAIYYHFFLLHLSVVLKFISEILSRRIKRILIKEEILQLFNYRISPLFDREYFGLLINKKQKSKYLFLYFKTLFYSLENKIKYIN